MCIIAYYGFTKNGSAAIPGASCIAITSDIIGAEIAVQFEAGDVGFGFRAEFNLARNGTLFPPVYVSSDYTAPYADNLHIFSIPIPSTSFVKTVGDIVTIEFVWVFNNSIPASYCFKDTTTKCKQLSIVAPPASGATFKIYYSYGGCGSGTSSSYSWTSCPVIRADFGNGCSSYGTTQISCTVPVQDREAALRDQAIAYAAPYWRQGDTITVNDVPYDPFYVPPTLAKIIVATTTASIDIGATTQFTAVCEDQYNATMTCPTLTWSSSNPAIASVNSSGLVTGVATGSTDIRATSGTVFGAATVTVTSPTPVLTTMTVSPVSQSINVGSVLQLTTICKDQNNATMTCPTRAWSSSNPTIASVNPSTGLVTGIAAGSTNIIASVGVVTSNASVITVTGIVSVLTSIAISPTSASIGIGGTRQLIATCKDQNSATMACPTPPAWSSSNPAIASVNPSTGLVTGVTAGNANITASVGVVASTASAITVTTTPPPQAGGGGMIVIAAVALMVAAMFMAKKPPSSPGYRTVEESRKEIVRKS